jgi:ADP-ribose pyrophosphatase YjhB (NUDIX family)
MFSQRTHIEQQTQGQPFCAGLILRYGDLLIFTLAKKRRWETTERGDIYIPVACPGGGQEVGESILDCARREGLEEVGQAVRLQHSPQTFHIDLDGEVTVIEALDSLAPFVFHIRSGPKYPYKPGLPIGEFLYVAHYLAELSAEPTPVDVPAIIGFTRSLIPTLLKGIQVKRAVATGMCLWRRDSIPESASLLVPEGSSEERILKMIHQGLL